MKTSYGRFTARTSTSIRTPGAPEGSAHPRDDEREAEGRDREVRSEGERYSEAGKAGGDFAALAKQYSDDPGSKDKGGEYDGVVAVRWTRLSSRQRLLGSRRKSAIWLRPSTAIHILQSLDREPAKVKSFEEVKAELAAEQKREAVYTMMQSVHREGACRVGEERRDKPSKSRKSTT